MTAVSPDRIEIGVAPALGEPLAVEFGNTRHTVRGDLREGLATTAMLAAWLRAHAGDFPGELAFSAARALGDGDLFRFVRLRDAVRALARALVNDAPPPAIPLATLNEAAATAPSWPRLSWAAVPLVQEVTAAPPPDAALSVIAASAVHVLGGPQRSALRACGGPGCVLFFVRRHPRRAWCSPGCGNRARVSRHYERHRAR
ncbi:CGNR zinc finger domain-containing protein [Actinomadura hibisca]|uniref:CGNR zinc finger domain-containing protein n=1 Tax=Actinomadura hibisca TaxID=68565 RepID=UPI000834DD5D|nr:ABATE domain-containing protein [Actinomadura hibisca]